MTPLQLKKFKQYCDRMNVTFTDEEYKKYINFQRKNYYECIGFYFNKLIDNSTRNVFVGDVAYNTYNMLFFSFNDSINTIHNKINKFEFETLIETLLK